MMKDEPKQTFDHDGIANSATDIETAPSVKNPPDEEKQLKVCAGPTIEAELQYVTGIKLYLAVASVSLAVFLMLLDISIIATAIPLITDQFHSLPDVGWYGSVYLLASCATQPLTGKVYTNFNIKYSFLAFIVVFELGSVLCAAAISSNMLIIGRAIAGMGSAGIMNGGLTIVAELAPMPKRPALTGVVMAIGQLGIVLGPLLGGALAQYANWRWCFYINLPIGAVAIGFLLLIHIPETLKASTSTTASKSTLASVITKFDLVGFAIFAPFAVMLLLALEWGGTKFSWSSATIIGLFCGAGVLLIVFLVWERRAGADAMVPFSILRVRIVWCSFLVITFFGGAMMIYSYYLPIYFQAVKGETPAVSGVDIFPGIVTQIFATVGSGVLLGKMGYYLPWMLTASVCMSIGLGLMGSFTVYTSTVQWAGYQILASFGRGCGMQMPTFAMQKALPPTQIAIGMTLLIFGQTFGGALFLALAQTILSHSLVEHLKDHAPTVAPQTVIGVGATAFRKVVKPDQIVGVLESYNLALNDVFFLSTGAAVGTFVFALGMGWVDIRKKEAADSITSAARQQSRQQKCKQEGVGDGSE